MDNKTQIDYLREKLTELRMLRDKAIMEKGLAAEENKDLRENSSYDFWETQENNFSARIHSVIMEIETLSRKAGIPIRPIKKKKKTPHK